MNFNEKLRETIRDRNSLVCVGLDTIPARIPQHLINEPDAVFAFNKAIIDATKDYVLAYKPNLAFYEALGTEGWDILRRTVAAIPEGILKIGDAKRGDIGSTARQYARALWNLGFDAVTLNPYLGRDAVAPFTERSDKGAIMLCLTSNPSSAELQRLEVEGTFLYLKVAEAIVRWNDNDNCGLVAGATHGSELEDIRRIAPDLPFLIPGVGAQGGDLKAAVLSGTDSRGEMAVINSSRGIIYASPGTDFAEAAGSAAKQLRDNINAIRHHKSQG